MHKILFKYVLWKIFKNFRKYIMWSITCWTVTAQGIGLTVYFIWKLNYMGHNSIYHISELIQSVYNTYFNPVIEKYYLNMNITSENVKILKS